MSLILYSNLYEGHNILNTRHILNTFLNIDDFRNLYVWHKEPKGCSCKGGPDDDPHGSKHVGQNISGIWKQNKECAFVGNKIIKTIEMHGVTHIKVMYTYLYCMCILLYSHSCPCFVD
jgi:hypothetical protein